MSIFLHEEENSDHHRKSRRPAENLEWVYDGAEAYPVARNLETIQGNSSNSNSNKKKEKGKGKEDCRLFWFSIF